MYLFHELPPEVRVKVAGEMARVVKPGGMVVLTDSAQLGDRPAWDQTMGSFGNFNEPFYRSYITADLGMFCWVRTVLVTSSSRHAGRLLCSANYPSACGLLVPGGCGCFRMRVFGFGNSGVFGAQVHSLRRLVCSRT